MKSILVSYSLPSALPLFLYAITPVDPHGGGLDAYGCYHNRKAGGYAIAVYSPGNPSQEEMLKNFRQRRVMERPKRMRRNKLKFPTPNRRF